MTLICFKFMISQCVKLNKQFLHQEEAMKTIEKIHNNKFSFKSEIKSALKEDLNPKKFKSALREHFNSKK